jgi:hypothetical protein
LPSVCGCRKGKCERSIACGLNVRCCRCVVVGLYWGGGGTRFFLLPMYEVHAAACVRGVGRGVWGAAGWVLLGVEGAATGHPGGCHAHCCRCGGAGATARAKCYGMHCSCIGWVNSMADEGALYGCLLICLWSLAQPVRTLPKLGSAVLGSTCAGSGLRAISCVHLCADIQVRGGGTIVWG